MRISIQIFSSLFGIFLFLASSTAFAQFDIQDCNSGVTGCSIILSSSSSSTTALGGGLFLTALLSTDRSRTMRKFLRNNRVALMADISMGSGKVLDDFSRLLAIPEKEIPRFAKGVRGQRKSFAKYMDLAIRERQGIEPFMIWINDLKANSESSKKRMHYEQI